MSMLERFPEIRDLTVEEQVELAHELWDLIENGSGEFVLSPEWAAELDRRIAEYERDPTQVTTWEEVKKRLLTLRRKDAA